jgi:hypothetical protein
MKTFAFNMTFTRDDENNAHVYTVGFNVQSDNLIDAKTQLRRRNAHLNIKRIALFAVMDEDGKVINETVRRYEIEAYRFRGTELWRVRDTFNGGKVVAKQFTNDAQAITRRDELNTFALKPYVQKVHDIDVNKRRFIAAYGKTPSGRGNWAFCAAQDADREDYLEHVFWFNGLFSEAQAAAVKHFQTVPNVRTIVVLS